MASGFGKRSGHDMLTNKVCHNTDDVQDLMLLDDNDTFPNSSLSLQIGSQPVEDDTTSDQRERGEILPIEGETAGTGLISFEVVAADKIKEGRSNYIKYTILVSGSNKVQKVPVTVEKRYSDFEKLNTQLRKNYPGIMEDVSFPGKLLIGNFKNETIAKRSRAFEQYLTHLYSINKIRFSQEFRHFFFETELRLANKFMLKGDNSEAVVLFEKCLPILEKILGFFHEEVVATLCALVVCYHCMDKMEMSIQYADSALVALQDNVDNPYYLPMLHQSIYLHWMLGRDKTRLESKLAELRQQGVRTEGNFNLKDLTLNRFS